MSHIPTARLGISRASHRIPARSCPAHLRVRYWKQQAFAWLICGRADPRPRSIEIGSAAGSGFAGPVSLRLLPLALRCIEAFCGGMLCSDCPVLGFPPSNHSSASPRPDQEGNRVADSALPDPIPLRVTSFSQPHQLTLRTYTFRRRTTFLPDEDDQMQRGLNEAGQPIELTVFRGKRVDRS